ncbi:hypothetical protein C8J56DRAFT_350002 [Mycena floridula]|nr:hypothetical protein C8J56DRAFT_350002 [Mycena floridula]
MLLDLRGEDANEKPSDVINFPNLESLVLLPPIRGSYNDLWRADHPRFNVLHSLRAPSLTSLMIFLDGKEAGKQLYWSLNDHILQFPRLEKLALVCKPLADEPVPREQKVVGPFPNLREVHLIGEIRYGILRDAGYLECTGSGNARKSPCVASLDYTPSVHWGRSSASFITRYQNVAGLWDSRVLS